MGTNAQRTIYSADAVFQLNNRFVIQVIVMVVAEHEIIG